MDIKQKQISDPVEQKGHVDFNREFIKLLGNPTSVKRFAPGSIALQNKLFYYLYSLYTHSKCMFGARNQGSTFLYFDTVSLFLLSYFFDLKQFSFVVHNNLEFALRNQQNRFMYRRIAKKVCLIYLEKRLRVFAEREFFHCNAVVIPHPIIPIKKMSVTRKKNVFVSSRNLQKDQLISICNGLTDDYTIICNGSFKDLNMANLEDGYIADFDLMLQSCEKVYLIGNYEFRSSGVLYRAISIPGIQIIVSDKSLFFELQEIKKEKELNILVELFDQK